MKHLHICQSAPSNNKAQHVIYKRKKEILEEGPLDDNNEAQNITGKRKIQILDKDQPEIPSLMESYEAQRKQRPKLEELKAKMIAVGLDLKCFSHIEDFSEDIMEHQTTKYFISSFIESKALGLHKQTACIDNESLTKQLINIGFMPNVATSFSMNIPVHMIEEQNSLFWGLLQFSVQFDIISSSRSDDFPFQPSTENMFFEISSPFKKKVDATDQHKYFTWIINITDKNSTESIIQSKLKELSQGDAKELFYHGTNQDHAKSILKNGIRLEEGKKKQDFSNGSGFYLSTDFDTAHNWANTKASPDSLGAAVLVYAVERDTLLVPEANNGLDLRQENTETEKIWKEIVQYFRKGIKDNQIERRHNLKDIHFIIGPICKNGGAAEKETPRLRRGDPMQLCIKNESLAERFGHESNLKCVVFFQPKKCRHTKKVQHNLR